MSETERIDAIVLRVVGGPLASQLQVIDVKTGRRLSGVRGVELSCHADTGYITARIELSNVEVDIQVGQDYMEWVIYPPTPAPVIDDFRT